MRTAGRASSAMPGERIKLWVIGKGSSGTSHEYLKCFPALFRFARIFFSMQTTSHSPLTERLSFIKDKADWGHAFRSGIRR